jgi:predicted PurR-regulated permease PerM
MFDSIDAVISKTVGVLRFLLRLLMPFLYGFVLAYLFNPLIIWFEKNLFKGKNLSAKGYKKYRIISIWIVYVTILALTSIALTFIIPKIVSSIEVLKKTMPDYLWQASRFTNETLKEYELFNGIRVFEHIEGFVLDFFKRVNLQNIDLENVFQHVGRGVISVTNIFFNLVLGFIIAFYLLLDKENFIREINKIIMVIAGEKKFNYITQAGKEINRIFSKFIIGKTIDSTIIGLLCFIGLLILKVPYALLLSVIVGITNMIPYFGPFIGAVPAIVITLFNDPLKSLWVAVFIFALQQFDGIVLGPKILGGSLKINPIWIIFGVIVGGGFFGVIGMLIGVPIVAIIRLFILRYVDKKFKSKQIKSESIEPIN